MKLFDKRESSRCMFFRCLDFFGFISFHLDLVLFSGLRCGIYSLPAIWSVALALVLFASSPCSLPLAHVYLSSRDGSPDPRPALAAIQTSSLYLALHDMRALLHDLLRFSQDELDVARVGHIGVNLLIIINPLNSNEEVGKGERGKTHPSVRAVCPSALLGRLVHLDMLDD